MSLPAGAQIVLPLYCNVFINTGHFNQHMSGPSMSRKYHNKSVLSFNILLFTLRAIFIRIVRSTSRFLRCTLSFAFSLYGCRFPFTGLCFPPAPLTDGDVEGTGDWVLDCPTCSIAAEATPDVDSRAEAPPDAIQLSFLICRF